MLGASMMAAARAFHLSCEDSLCHDASSNFVISCSALKSDATNSAILRKSKVLRHLNFRDFTLRTQKPMITLYGKRAARTNPCNICFNYKTVITIVVFSNSQLQRLSLVISLAPMVSSLPMRLSTRSSLKHLIICPRICI